MTNTSAVGSMGRPREFNTQAALQAALLVFWRSGYAATSLDDLTAAMGLSRSSFYGAFGTKHDVLLAGVRLYVDGVYANLQALAVAQHDPVDCIRAVVGMLARPREDGNGCLLVNSVAELAPDDLEVCEIARMQVGRVTRLLQGLLAKAGHKPDRTWLSPAFWRRLIGCWRFRARVEAGRPGSLPPICRVSALNSHNAAITIASPHGVGAWMPG